MKLPKGYTEQQVLDIFDQVIKKLAKKFTFGYRDEDDIYQEAILLAMEGLERFDGKRPLANFIYVHVRNRLCNYKRKHYVRIEPPCTRCPLNAFIPPDGCKAYNDKMDCDLYERWHNRNIVKRNLTHALEYGQVKHDDHNENNMKYFANSDELVDKKEVFSLIDKHLSISLRKIYLMMMNNIKVNKKDEQLVHEEIIKILKKEGYNL